MTRIAPSTLTTGVTRTVLPNGLTVLVKETPTAPAVAVVTHVKAGYFHEPDEIAGISHVIEHMFFNGTNTRPDPEAISRETKAHGGSLNAGTIYDRTSYYVVLPSERWREGLAIQADALQDPLFDPETLDREMQAILQEARRKLDNPAAYGREKLYELAFEKHRMRRWRIGTEDVLSGLSREDLVQFYEDHYRPENIVLTVVGDVQKDEVLGAIRELYGDMPRGHLRKHTGPAEPRQESFRYDRLRNELLRGYTFIGFHTPGELHPDNPALEVLATILGTGRSARLPSRLREELGIVSSVGASVYQFDDVGLFEVSATFDPEHTEWVTNELFAEIERIKWMGPTDGEIARARGIIEAAEAFGQEDVLGQAMLLAGYEAQGDIFEYDRELAALRAVDAAAVQRVAREYLALENASLLEYVTHQVIGERTVEEQAGHLRGAVLAAAQTMPSPEVVDSWPSLRPREEIRTWAAQLIGEVGAPAERHVFELPLGGTLVVQVNPNAPTVSAQVDFFGGRTNESRNVSGITAMMQRMMVKQTRNRSVEQLANEIEALGTQVQRIANDDWFGFAVSSRVEDFAQALDVLFDVVTQPEFEDEQYAKELELQRAAIQAVEDQSSAMAVLLLRSALYRDHPYGLPELGIHQSLRFLDANRVDAQHFDLVRPETMVVSVSGRVDPAAVYEYVRGYVERWNPMGEASPNTVETFYSSERVEQLPAFLSVREVGIDKKRAQTAMVLAYPTVDRRHPDAPVFEVLSAITGGLGGTFFEEIRGNRGLAYQVSTFSATRTMGGYFGTFVACSPEQYDTVKELVIGLHAGLAVDPPAPADVERAQNYLVGSYRVGGQTNAARSSRVAATLMSGKPLESLDTYEQRIRAVTRDDIARVAREYFVDKPYAIGVVHGTIGRGADPEDSR